MTMTMNSCAYAQRGAGTRPRQGPPSIPDNPWSTCTCTCSPSTDCLYQTWLCESGILPFNYLSVFLNNKASHTYATLYGSCSLCNPIRNQFTPTNTPSHLAQLEFGQSLPRHTSFRFTKSAALQTPRVRACHMATTLQIL